MPTPLKERIQISHELFALHSLPSVNRVQMCSLPQADVSDRHTSAGRHPPGSLFGFWRP